MKKPHFFQYLYVLIFSVFVLGCQSEASITTLRLGHSLDTQHPVHKAMVILGQEIEKQ